MVFYVAVHWVHSLYGCATMSQSPAAEPGSAAVEAETAVEVAAVRPVVDIETPHDAAAAAAPSPRPLMAPLATPRSDRTITVQINHKNQEVTVKAATRTPFDTAIVETYSVGGQEVVETKHRVTRRHSSATVPEGFDPNLSKSSLSEHDGGAIASGDGDEGADSDAKSSRGAKLSSMQQLCLNLSFAVNVALVVIKLIAAIASGSIVVVASALDSALDILYAAVVTVVRVGCGWLPVPTTDLTGASSIHGIRSGAILFFTARAVARQALTRYPVGKTRLAPVGTVIFASVMGTSTATVVLESIQVLAAGRGDPLDVDTFVLVILVTTIVLKAGLFLLCTTYADGSGGVRFVGGWGAHAPRVWRHLWVLFHFVL